MSLVNSTSTYMSGRSLRSELLTSIRARAVRLAFESDNRDVHPEGFAGRGGAMIRVGVEGDIHVVVEGEVGFGAGLFGEE